MRFIGFTRRIWQTFGSAADKRADYLWELYRAATTLKREDRYLDIGCGRGQNAIAFGQDCQSIHCLDIQSDGLRKCRSVFRQKGIDNVSFYQGDAQVLPFRDAAFDRVSMISVIEHLRDKHLAVREASRVLRLGGELILQVPNKYFFVDLHTGLPLLHALPCRVRRWVLARLGYQGMPAVTSTSVPSKRGVRGLIGAEFARVHALKVIYPPDLVLPRLRPVYFALKALGAFALAPFGFLFIASEARSASSQGGNVP